MRYQETFQVPNSVVDRYYTLLSGTEVKLLFLIIRQTHGWMDQSTGRRKERDWISHSQFIKKTGLSRRVLSSALQRLIALGLVTATNAAGGLLSSAGERKVSLKIYYSPGPNLQPVQKMPTTSADFALYKTNYTKIKEIHNREGRARSVGDILQKNWKEIEGVIEYRDGIYS